MSGVLCKKESFSRFMEMDFCSCFGFIKEPKRALGSDSFLDIWSSRGCLLLDNTEDSFIYSGDPNNPHGGDNVLTIRGKSFEEIFRLRSNNGTICREVPVKETCRLIRTEDEDGNKMVNEYVRIRKIGSGSYGKVVLYRSNKDGKQYAMKAFHKSHLLKLRVAPSETAMTDVHREVSIMKMLCHPNIVNLIEVIDDPNTDQFYMVLEYVESKWVCEGSGPAGCLEKSIARRYIRDIVAGLIYLHAHNIVHGDIKPDNLLVTRTGAVKIGDFGVSQVFEDDNDELRRSPGTPVFTAPECCLGLTYRGKAADIWALGVTLYCVVFGQYPFLGDTGPDTYDKIVNNPLTIPAGIDTHLKNLLEGILCKDPEHRMTLEAVAEHPWVIQDEGPIPQFMCLCKRRSFQEEHNHKQNLSD